MTNAALEQGQLLAYQRHVAGERPALPSLVFSHSSVKLIPKSRVIREDNLQACKARFRPQTWPKASTPILQDHAAKMTPIATSNPGQDGFATVIAELIAC